MDYSFLTSLPIAHRGLHDDRFPENSLPAFLAAAQKGYAIETDVRISKDGNLYLFHDDNLNRMTGCDKNFSDCTSDEIDTLLLEGKEHIPTLEEFLKTIDGKTPILLEIKNVPSEYSDMLLKKTAEAFKSYQGIYAMQSFNPFYVKKYKKLCPDVSCGLLATANPSKADFGGSLLWRFKAYAVKHMSFNRYARPDFISYYFHDYPNKATNKYKGAKLAWTVRSPEDETYARKYADNIIFENYDAEIPNR